MMYSKYVFVTSFDVTSMNLYACQSMLGDVAKPHGADVISQGQVCQSG